MNIKVTDEILGDYFACPCGNRADLKGFETSDREGHPTEPKSLWRDLYMCVQCGRIYDQEGTEIAVAVADQAHAK